MTFQIDPTIASIAISFLTLVLGWIGLKFNSKKIITDSLQREKEKSEKAIIEKTVMEESMKQVKKDVEGIGDKVRTIQADHGGRITEMEKNYAVQNTKLDQIIDLLKANTTALTRHVEEHHANLSN